MNFSEEQKNAIMHKEGACLVVAGPGSGKTTVITKRIKYLIESAGVSPADILVITFTRAAALEMETRFKELAKGRDYQVRFGTFHSIFFWIIKTAYNLPNSCIIQEDEKRKIISGLMDRMSLSYDNKEDIVSDVIAQISLVKCDMLDIEDYYSTDMPAESFRQIYKGFEDEKRRRGFIDFDDMLVMCYELLSTRKDILAKCRSIFKYIMIDEFQDSNKIQYETIKLLAMPRNNIFVVGDDDQSVYGFRGARPEIMHRFISDFPKTNKIELGTNYRCDKSITFLSSRVISGNSNRFKKKLISTSSEDGTVRIISTKNIAEENAMVIKQIKDNVAEGIPYERQAVLYRTNIQPRRLAYRLDSFNIPYTISDSLPNIFEHFIVSNILDYMKIAMGDTSRATFLRIMNKPSRYISRDVLLEEEVDYDKIRWRLRDKDYVVDNLDKFMADMKLIKKMRPYPALNFIRNGVGFDDYVKKYAEFRQLDTGELLDVLDEFAAMIKDVESYEALFEFIADYTEVMKKQQEKKKSAKGLNLMTMHSAKGLEFDCVYIIDAVEGICPYKKAKTSAEIEEERRMFYVAMTRARHKLYIYTPKLVHEKAKETSRYVREIKKYFKENDGLQNGSII